PLKDVRSISHEIKPGLRAEVRLEGDVFEMEDHRNWTDASYKTYSGPLDRSDPVPIDAGTKVTQSVTLILRGQTSAPPARSTSVTLTIGHPGRTTLPRIGLGIASHGQPLGRQSLERLRRLHLVHLRADLVLSEPGWTSTLQRASAEGRALDVPLEVAVFV